MFEKIGKAWNATKSFVARNTKKVLTAVGIGTVAAANQAQAVIDTTSLDLIKTDAEAWLVYGVAAAVGIMLVGLAYHGAKLAYGKMKGGMKSG